MRRKYFVIFLLAITALAFSQSSLEKYLAKRKKAMFVRMRKFNLTPRVKQAFMSVRRQDFAYHRTNSRASVSNVRSAYEEMPLAIGYGQTISSPNMVALMTNLCIPDANDRVLEIGTGSGFQGAVISKLCKEIYSIEIVKPLGEDTAKVFKRKGYNNVKTKVADGYYGWSEYAPFDKILVTCATNHIPPALIKQLKRGGIMLIPVGHPYKVQQLIEVRKLMNGKIKTKRLMNVRFVPMTGRALKGRR
jgi:protein-L-isoaspartate(D-aspartate) O-methyltransferase